MSFQILDGVLGYCARQRIDHQSTDKKATKEKDCDKGQRHHAISDGYAGGVDATLLLPRIQCGYDFEDNGNQE
jgi:hypothetical protein